MAEFTIPGHGEICWNELATSDLGNAKNFYSELFGWKLEQSKVSPMEYTEIHSGEKAVGGMMQIDENWGDNPPPPHWTMYVAVENADETTEKIKAMGGTIIHGPFDAPNVGRMAMALDPSGAKFSIIQFTEPSSE